jgi:hypothetical protein
MFSVSNLLSYSQAGRRRFESGLQIVKRFAPPSRAGFAQFCLFEHCVLTSHLSIATGSARPTARGGLMPEPAR